MPGRWWIRYLLALLVVVIWGGVILWFAPHLPLRPKLVEFAGTLLTLLPVIIDLHRRRFLHRNVPDTRGDFAGWALGNARGALLGFEWPVAICIVFGISLIALGFAMDLVRPECPACA